ncbi:MAG: polyprenyl synthetase family protein [Candidatus Omnitrophota bacterium]
MRKHNVTVKKFLKDKAALIDKHLSKILPGEKDYPSEIHKAMRYAVFSGGKRIRPILCLAACRSVGGVDADALSTACAIELIHNYSLVHDDLPALDNDDTRRGKPTVHKKFSESTAVLTGDALLTLAFSILSQNRNAKRGLRIMHEIAQAISTFGMIGGQVVDMQVKDKSPDIATLKYINIHKTGKLIAVALKTGAISAGARETEIERMFKFGEYAGLIFQIVDDILDNEGYVKIFGRQGAYLEAERLTKEAQYFLRPFGKKATVLQALLDFVLMRSY